MNFNKYKVLVVGCTAAVFLCAYSTVKLVQNLSANSKDRAELKSSELKLAALERNIPYPDTANLAIVASNAALVSNALSKTLTELQMGQASVDVNSRDFVPTVEQVVKRLKDNAIASAVNLPPDFAFGFDFYLKSGSKPSSNNLSRLFAQLETIEVLAKILFDAKVTNVVSVNREVFENNESQPRSGVDHPQNSIFVPEGRDSGGTSSAQLLASAKASSELFDVERFYLEFQGRESSVWAVFDGLAKNRSCLVLHYAQIEAELPVNASPAGFRGTGSNYAPLSAQYNETTPLRSASQLVATNATFLVSREDRIIAGRETVKVTIIVDAYRFKQKSGGEP